MSFWAQGREILCDIVFMLLLFALVLLLYIYYMYFYFFYCHNFCSLGRHRHGCSLCYFSYTIQWYLHRQNRKKEYRLLHNKQHNDSYIGATDIPGKKIDRGVTSKCAVASDSNGVVPRLHLLLLLLSLLTFFLFANHVLLPVISYAIPSLANNDLLYHYS